MVWTFSLPEDDAACVAWDGGWRMPTNDEIIALCDACGVPVSGALVATSISDASVTVSSDGTLPKGAYWCEDGQTKISSIKIPGMLLSNGTSTLFFPAAGRGDGAELKDVNKGFYWTNSLRINEPAKALAAAVTNQNFKLPVQQGRNYGYSIRPVWSQPVESITLTESAVSISKDETYTISATVAPDDAYNKNLIFRSANPDIATVNATTGEVTGVDFGTTDIIVIASYGCTSATDTCTVTVKRVEKKIVGGHEAVQFVEDGLWWATMNIGATSIADDAGAYGNYFAWGAAELAYSGLSDSKFEFLSSRPMPYDEDPWDVQGDWDKDSGFSLINTPFYKSDTWTKFNPGKGSLGQDEDAANKIWENGWKMPDPYDFCELYYACGGEYDEENDCVTLIPTPISDPSVTVSSDGTLPKGAYWCGSNQTKISSIKIPGLLLSNGTSTLFFPAAGYGDGTDLKDAGVYGHYWTYQVCDEEYEKALSFDFSDAIASDPYSSKSSRALGFTIRPIHY